MKQIFRIFYVFTLLSILNTRLQAQNETKIWYFGTNAGLDFNTNPPTILTNGMLNSSESCASIADASGNLLFYTDGVTIWDRTHNVMANGSGLLGHQSASQGPLIIKKPGSSVIYFVFTLDSGSLPNGLQYSIVDMSLAAGNGSVTIKNVLIYAPSEEKLTAAKHKNGTDVWILNHEYNSGNFRSYLLTAAGVNTNAVVSSIGVLHDGSPTTSIGYMKVSPDCKKIGVCVGGFHTCELYDFDNSTGLLSNLTILTNTLAYAYGCEFSRDGGKFYAAGLSDTVLYQWDLCKNTNSAIIQSKTVIHTSTITMGGMQLATDGKIYVARYNQQFLGVINEPNKLGTSCNYTELGQSVSPKTSVIGLPNFSNYFFWSGPTLTISASNNFSMCSGETITLSAMGANTYTWNAVTVSQSIAVSPTLTSSYTVVGTTTAGCKFDRVTTVSVSACVGIPESKKINTVSIYPNPVVDKLKVLSVQGNTYVGYSIFNMTGEEIKREDLNTESSETEIATHDLANGIYYLQLETRDQQIHIEKFIILK